MLSLRLSTPTAANSCTRRDVTRTGMLLWTCDWSVWLEYTRALAVVVVWEMNLAPSQDVLLSRGFSSCSNNSLNSQQHITHQLERVSWPSKGTLEGEYYWTRLQRDLFQPQYTNVRGKLTSSNFVLSRKQTVLRKIGLTRCSVQHALTSTPLGFEHS